MTSPAAPRRRRPMPRAVTVETVSRPTPRLVSVTVTGGALEGFAEPAPTAHIKVFFPEADGVLALPTPGPDGPVWPDDQPRPTVRTYTPRRYDPVTNTLEIQFVLHGHGPAARWAAAAKPGDRIAVAGPGGRFQLDPEVRDWLILADESALPAVGMLLEALSETARAEVHLEVEDADDELPLDSRAKVDLAWHHRRGAATGPALVEAARTAAPGTHVWVAGEARVIREIRALLFEAGHTAATTTTRGYWRGGEANHPDHDYGED